MADVLKTELSIELKGKKVSCPEVKQITTTSEVVTIGAKKIFDTSDLADASPAWMLNKITSAAT